ncbi:hypothetical protein OTU49_010853, partial [Cherax quadricarinatus]
LPQAHPPGCSPSAKRQLLQEQRALSSCVRTHPQHFLQYLHQRQEDRRCLTVKVRSLLMEWNRASQKSLAQEGEMVSMVPLSVPVSLQHKHGTPTPSPMVSRVFSRRPPMETHLEENDESSGYSSSHAHSFRSYHDMTCTEHPLRGHVWDNHHSC